MFMILLFFFVILILFLVIVLFITLSIEVNLENNNLRVFFYVLNFKINLLNDRSKKTGISKKNKKEKKNKNHFNFSKKIVSSVLKSFIYLIKKINVKKIDINLEIGDIDAFEIFKKYNYCLVFFNLLHLLFKESKQIEKLELNVYPNYLIQKTRLKFNFYISFNLFILLKSGIVFCKNYF